LSLAYIEPGFNKTQLPGWGRKTCVGARLDTKVRRLSVVLLP
jgi:hypothetical protein